MNYRLRMLQVKGRCITDPEFESVNNTFERALVFMHKMPRVWIDYCQFLMSQKKITRIRKVSTFFLFLMTLCCKYLYCWWCEYYEAANGCGDCHFCWYGVCYCGKKYLYQRSTAVWPKWTKCWLSCCNYEILNTCILRKLFGRIAVWHLTSSWSLGKQNLAVWV